MEKHWSLRVPFLALTVVFIVDLTLIFLIHSSWRSTIDKYLPLQKELMLLQNEIAKGHIWIEEALSGDQHIDVETDVFQRFNNTRFLTFAHNIKEHLVASQDEVFIHCFESTSKDLAHINHLAKKRWGDATQHGSGSHLDQEFDRYFNATLKRIDTCIMALEQRIQDEFQKKERMFAFVVFLFIGINIIVVTSLYYIIKRKIALENAFFHEQERAKITLHSIGDAVISTDIHGIIDFMNSVAENLTGYTLEEARGLSLSEVFHIVNAITGLPVESPLVKVLKEGIIVGLANSTKLINRHGNAYIISDSAAPIRNEQGEILGAVLVFQDDTPRHTLEEQIRDSETQYRLLIENIKSHYYFYSHDPHGVFTYLSDSVTDVLGYSKEDFLTHFSTFLTDDPMNAHVQGYTDHILKGEQQPPYTVSVYHHNGSTRYLEITESPRFDDQGHVISIDGVARDITEYVLIRHDLEMQRDIMHHSAHHDILTGLPNRVLFLDRLEQAIKKAERYDNITAVMFIDLDHFKEVNDSLGHHIGDLLLKEIAYRLQSQLRKSDTLARLGGDEFTILMEEIFDASHVIDIIQKLMRSLRKPAIVDGRTIYVAVSVGITLYPEDGQTADELLKNADTAMYKAKEDGRNTYRFYTEEMTQRAYERLQIETKLREAIDKDRLAVHFQPQFNALDNSVIGMEALVRWHDPDLGSVSPARFIPIAEECGLIVQLDRWIITYALIQWRTWLQQGFKLGKLSLNLSVKHLFKKDVVAFFTNALEASGCPPEYIELEVTEGQLMKKPEDAIAVLHALKNLGVTISVDDFGTGYSSLSYLKRLPINKLKIDRSFIKDLPNDHHDVAITLAIIALAKSMNLDLIAEGVETEAQKAFLIEHECILIQGFLFSKALAPSEIETTYLKA